MNEEEDKQIVEDDPLTSDQEEEFEDSGWEDGGNGEGDEDFDDSGYEDGDYGDGYDEDYSGGDDPINEENERGSEGHSRLREKADQAKEELEDRAKQAVKQGAKKGLERIGMASIGAWGPWALAAAGVLMLIILVGFAIFGLGSASDSGDDITGPVDDNPIQGPDNLIGLQARIVEIALSQLGVKEVGTNKGSEVCMYLNTGGCNCPNPWCAGFVSWVYQQAGATGIRSCGATNLINQFNISPHQKLDIDTNMPQPGDVIYRSSPSTHVGIVYKVDSNGTLYTIEGNTGSGVVKTNKYSSYGRNNWSYLGRY